MWRAGGKGQATREEESSNGMKNGGQRKRKKGEIEGKNKEGNGKRDRVGGQERRWGKGH